MKLKYTLAALAVTTIAANAATTILDATGDSINQANMAVANGQTFTATGLGTDTQLATIVMAGPQTDDAVRSVFGIEISVNGAAHGVWSPGVALGEVGTLDTFGGATFDFTSLNITLTEGTVYALRFTDGAGTDKVARLGLSNGAAAGTGGSAPGAFSDGTLFSGGATVFSDGFDTAMAITTVPEPSSTALLGLGGLALILRRRK